MSWGGLGEEQGHQGRRHRSAARGETPPASPRHHGVPASRAAPQGHERTVPASPLVPGTAAVSGLPQRILGAETPVPRSRAGTGRGRHSHSTAPLPVQRRDPGGLQRPRGGRDPRGGLMPRGSRSSSAQDPALHPAGLTPGRGWKRRGGWQPQQGPARAQLRDPPCRASPGYRQPLAEVMGAPRGTRPRGLGVPQLPQERQRGASMHCLLPAPGAAAPPGPPG